MATDVTVTSFRAQFPQSTHFPDATEAQIESALEEACILHSLRELATLYLTAHLLAIDSEHTGKPDGGSGIVSMERIGPRTINYLNQIEGAGRKAFFASTSYGRRFLELEARTPRYGIGAMAV